MSDGIQKREYFRIVFPSSEIPTAEILGKKYPVLNLSAGGVCVSTGPDLVKLEANKDEVEISITLKSGKKITIGAKLLRLDGPTAVYKFSKEAPLAFINDEQFRIRRILNR